MYTRTRFISKRLTQKANTLILIREKYRTEKAYLMKLCTFILFCKNTYFSEIGLSQCWREIFAKCVNLAILRFVFSCSSTLYLTHAMFERTFCQTVLIVICIYLSESTEMFVITMMPRPNCLLSYMWFKSFYMNLLRRLPTAILFKNKIIISLIDNNTTHCWVTNKQQAKLY